MVVELSDTSPTFSARAYNVARFTKAPERLWMQFPRTSNPMCHRQVKDLQERSDKSTRVPFTGASLSIPQILSKETAAPFRKKDCHLFSTEDSGNG
jgi:hypothetical protein